MIKLAIPIVLKIKTIFKDRGVSYLNITAFIEFHGIRCGRRNCHRSPKMYT